MTARSASQIGRLLKLLWQQGVRGAVNYVGVRVAPPSVPGACGSLWIGVHHQGNEPRCTGGGSKMNGERGLARTALLADHG